MLLKLSKCYLFNLLRSRWFLWWQVVLISFSSDKYTYLSIHSSLNLGLFCPNLSHESIIKASNKSCYDNDDFHLGNTYCFLMIFMQILIFMSIYDFLTLIFSPIIWVYYKPSLYSLFASGRLGLNHLCNSFHGSRLR